MLSDKRVFDLMVVGKKISTHKGIHVASKYRSLIIPVQYPNSSYEKVHKTKRRMLFSALKCSLQMASFPFSIL